MRASGTTGIEPVHRALGIGGILDEGFRLFQRSAARLLLIAAVVYAPGIAFLVLALDAAGTALNEHLVSGGIPAIRSIIVLAALPSTALFAIQTFSAPLAAVALTLAIEETRRGQTWTVGSILKETAFGVGPRALGAGLLLGLAYLASAVIPLALVGGGAFLAFGRLALSGDIASILLLLLVAGVIALVTIAAGTYVALRYAVALPALAIERRSILESLSRSAGLVSGRYAAALGLFSILMTMSALLGSSLSLLAPFPSFESVDLEGLKALIPALIRSQIWSAALGQVLGLLTATYGAICWTLFFFSLRAEKEPR